MKGRKNNKKNLFTLSSILIYTLITALFALAIFIHGKDQMAEEIDLSTLATSINQNQVTEITVKGEKVKAKLVDGTEVYTYKEPQTSIVETLGNYGIEGDKLSDIKIQVKSQTNLVSILFEVIFYSFILFFFISYMGIFFGGKKSSKSKLGLFSFGQSKFKVVQPNSIKTTFKDIAGNDEAKEELQEVVQFLKKPDKFIKLGAEIPKGVLLVGEPGTGKTLMARAVAGEAGVPFLYVSGSEFVEMFVGVGASRVRDLFSAAKRMAPSIIFIDEIDAVGRSRGIGIGGGNDEREQTLNQILVEMDGFDKHTHVIVIAATNRADVLDPALLRPGRFDRRVIINMPDRREREEIIKIHLRNKPVDKNLDIKLVAQRTHGFSGADIKALINEAAILAAKMGDNVIKQKHILDSIDKVMLGPEKKKKALSDKERQVVAYHEAGHAIVASLIPEAPSVHKVSIVSRGHAGGYTLNHYDEEKTLMTKEEFLANIAVAMGGRMAEEVKFGEITNGAESDIENVTSLARNMVLSWGMSDKVGPVSIDSRVPQYKQSYDILSDRKKEEVDSEITRIIKEQADRAKNIIKNNIKLLDRIAEELLQKEVIEKEEYDEILKEYGINA